MLTLYHAPRSRSFRVLWLLEELGVPYDTEMVSIRGTDSAGHMPADYIDIHPHRKVPALVTTACRCSRRRPSRCT